MNTRFIVGVLRSCISDKGTVTLQGIMDETDCSLPEAFDALMYCVDKKYVGNENNGVFEVLVDKGEITELAIVENEEEAVSVRDYKRRFSDDELTVLARELKPTGILCITSVREKGVQDAADIGKGLYEVYRHLEKRGVFVLRGGRYYCVMSEEDFGRLKNVIKDGPGDLKEISDPICVMVLSFVRSNLGVSRDKLEDYFDSYFLSNAEKLGLISCVNGGYYPVQTSYEKRLFAEIDKSSGLVELFDADTDIGKCTWRYEDDEEDEDEDLDLEAFLSEKAREEKMQSLFAKEININVSRTVEEKGTVSVSITAGQAPSEIVTETIKKNFFSSARLFETKSDFFLYTVYRHEIDFEESDAFFETIDEEENSRETYLLLWDKPLCEQVNVEDISENTDCRLLIKLTIKS